MPRYRLGWIAGRAVTHEDFRGRFQLVMPGFVSPRCSPDHAAGVQARARTVWPRGRPGGSQPIFITVDPSATRARCCATTRRLSTPRILALTGSPELDTPYADSFRIQYESARAGRRAGKLHHEPYRRRWCCRMARAALSPASPTPCRRPKSRNASAPRWASTEHAGAGAYAVSRRRCCGRRTRCRPLLRPIGSRPAAGPRRAPCRHRRRRLGRPHGGPPPRPLAPELRGAAD